mmetsp:Transcript_38044/g.120907  ORF Transcript_38044/g.120907 Transcript_38044/m.120907 type:complete len:257 (-) Transcript_38044:2781-3551(-)
MRPKGHHIASALSCLACSPRSCWLRSRCWRASPVQRSPRRSEAVVASSERPDLQASSANHFAWPVPCLLLRVLPRDTHGNVLLIDCKDDLDARTNFHRVLSSFGAHRTDLPVHAMALVVRATEFVLHMGVRIFYAWVVGGVPAAPKQNLEVLDPFLAHLHCMHKRRAVPGHLHGLVVCPRARNEVRLHRWGRRQRGPRRRSPGARRQLRGHLQVAGLPQAVVVGIGCGLLAEGRQPEGVDGCALCRVGLGYGHFER